MAKILYLITEDWFFVSHFLPMARAAQEIGLDVVVAARVNGDNGRLAAEGIRVVPLNVERSSLGIVDAVRNIAQAYRIIVSEQPDIVHCIALRPVLLGGMAAKLARARQLILAPTGLGHLWTERAMGARLLRSMLRMVVGGWLRGPRTTYLFENEDDPREFRLDAHASKVCIVRGAGVRPDEFPHVDEPAGPPIKVAVVARMIAPKGIAEAVEAVRRARAHGSAIELDLYGATDRSNRRAIPEATLRAWSAEPGIHWYGRTEDVAAVWCDHHIALYLSYYREGVPRSLIEAAAAGRPIVAADVVGCRDVVRDGIEGFLVPPGDVEAAAQALEKLAAEPALRERMGYAAHARFLACFTEAAVKETVINLYRRLMRGA